MATRDTLEKAFDELDNKGSGSLDWDDIKEYVMGNGAAPMTEKEVETIMAMADLDGDGKIDKNEFVTFLLPNEVKQQESLEQAFQELDTDNTGTLDWEAIKEYVMGGGEHPLTEEEVTTIIEMADLDGDGKIDKHEFVTFFMKPPEPKKGKSKQKMDDRVYEKSTRVDKLDSPDEGSGGGCVSFCLSTVILVLVIIWFLALCGLFA